MSWVPPDLSSLCRPLVQSSSCSPAAALFLQLIAQMFGYPRDNYLHSSEEHNYDFIIVGAGSAGCVLANRLSEVKQWKVLLLEAGPEEPLAADVPAFAPIMMQSNIDWMYRTQPEARSCLAYRGRGCGWARGKVMGGSSTINYMIYVRGNPKDYDEWEALGNPGWGFKDVIQYFKKSEDNTDAEVHAASPGYHAVGGYQTVQWFPYQDHNIKLIIDGWNEMGYPEIDVNGPSQLGVTLHQHTTRQGERLSTNMAFIRPIRRKRRNLNVLTHAQVIRVLIDPSTNTAFGVEYVLDGENTIRRAFASKEVILSAGALNSPKILMLSGVGPRKHLQSLGIPVIKNLPVGQNLQDHVTVTGVLISLNNTATDISPFQRMEQLQQYARSKQGPLSATGPLQVGAFTITKYSEAPESADIQYSFDAAGVEDFVTNPTGQPNVQPLSYYNGIMIRPIVLRPRSRGVVLLNNTDPIWGPPLLYPNYFGNLVDLETLVEGIKVSLNLLYTKPFRQVDARLVNNKVPECQSLEFATDDYWRCLAMFYTATIYHPVGTCKMGPAQDPQAVVDHALRVYAVRNLRVIDASVMPVIVRGNTNAPTIMIGEKGADMIKRSWGVHN